MNKRLSKKTEWDIKAINKLTKSLQRINNAVDLGIARLHKLSIAKNNNKRRREGKPYYRLHTYEVYLRKQCRK